MTEKNVWFITGASRGMGIHIARAALAAGADAVKDLEQKAQRLLAQADTYRELSSSLAHNTVT